MTSREGAVRAVLERACGKAIGSWRWERVGGGSINEAARILAGGGSWFVKWNERGLEGHFAAEAAGLRALAAAGSGFRIPSVIACEDGPAAYLLLEDLGSGSRAPDHDERFGRELARLHRRSDARGFGFDTDGYCGATPQPNGWMTSWVEFYRERRLRPMLDRARQRGLRDAERLDALLERLGEYLGEPTQSSLIHGDLWSGNAHVTREGDPALLDPAAYFADREAELGMMSLFGGFGARVWDAYRESFPLQGGWEERMPLYELYHVLNHHVLFGGGYGAQAVRIARRYVG